MHSFCTAHQCTRQTGRDLANAVTENDDVGEFQLCFSPIQKEHSVSCMSNHAPSDEVYASHGLVDVQLDDYRPSSHDWISGTARLNRTNLPCISNPSSRVRFEWAASDLSVFKRRAQFIAIDTLPLQGGSSIIGKNGKLRESKYTTAEEIVAWWEIDSGCWLLTTERESGVSEMLIDRWEDTVEGDQKWSWACFNLVAIVDVLEVS